MATSFHSMNIHHLELFYYVARHGGISEAVRNIPYGIQQPAVSGQIAQLEEYLGVTLFHRRPFSLTPPGQKLYRFIEPFFTGVDALATELQGGTTHQIRIASANVILRDYMPELLQSVRKKFPGLRITLRQVISPKLEALLQQQEIDLAVAVMERKTASGVNSLVLLELPMVLIVPANSEISSAEELWKRDKIAEPLICLPPEEILSKHFQQGLSKIGVDWFPSIEINSTDSIETYVANGFGIGVSVSIPKTKMSPKVRSLPLPGFPHVVLGALWRGKPTPPLKMLLEELQARARRFSA
jgi:DNA-binding transcriptional LysR family regulator